MEEQTEIRLTVGQLGIQTQKRFVGAKLASWRTIAGKDKSAYTEIWTAYRTAHDRVAVHHRHSVDWYQWSWSEDDNLAFREHPDDPEGLLNEKSEATLDVYDTFDELRGKVPDEFFIRVEHAMTTPAVEVLDI